MACLAACKVAGGAAIASNASAPTPLPGLAGVEARLRTMWSVLSPAAPATLLAAAALLVSLTGAALARAWLRRRRLAKMAAGGSWFRLIPPPEPDLDGGRVFWQTLQHLRRRDEPWVVWHFLAVPGMVGIWLWVPEVIAETNLMRAVEGAWKGARTERGDPPAVEAPVLPSRRAMRSERARWHRARKAGEPVEEPRTPPSRLVGTELALHAAAPHALDHGAREAHMGMLMAQVQDLEPGEAVVVQVLARPARARAYRRLLQAAAGLEEEVQQLRVAKAPGATRAAGRVRAAEPKLADALYEARLRVAVLANHPGRATSRIDGVTSAFGVLRGTSQSLERRPADIDPGDLRHRRGGEVLSVDEMSALAALPAASVLEASRARVVPAGKEVATEGVVLGLSVGRHVALRLPDVLYHAQVVGPTGAGKTTLLTKMALQLLEGGWSVVAADIVKGDIPDWLLARLPAGLEHKVCVIDPTAACVPGVNVLATDNPALTTEQLLTTFSRLYAGAWGARIEAILRAAFMTLAMAGGTLIEVPLLLTDDRFRARILGQVISGDGPGRSALAIEQLRGFWETFGDKSDSAQARDLDSVLYKLESFMPPSVAAVIGQVNPKGDPLSLIDEGGLVLVRAPRGEVGDGPASLLASLVAIRMWQRVQGRSTLSEAERKGAQRVAFVADEAQDLFGSKARSQSRTAEEMFVQGRGLGQAFILGHQHLGQLSEDLQATLMTNARTKILFQCSEADARKFAAEMAPEFRPADLMALSAYQAVCKPCIRGGQGAPFSFRTEDLEPGSPERLAQVLAASAQRWARPRAEVEEEMVARHRGHLAVVR